MSQQHQDQPRAGFSFEGLSSEARTLYKHPDGLGHVIYDPRAQRLYLIDESSGRSSFALISTGGLYDMAAGLIDLAGQMEQQGIK